MPRIIQAPPNPVRQVFLDYVSMLQQQRYRAEQERAQEREDQKQRTIAGVGLGLGAVGGIAIAGAMAPAATAAGSAVGLGTGIAAPVAGGLSTMGAVSAGLTGAAVGGRIAEQMGQGDYVGGITTAAEAAQGIQQSIEDKETFGYSPSPQERAMFSRAAMKAGYTMPELAAAAKATGGTIAGVLSSAEAAQADDKHLRGMLSEIGFAGSLGDFDQMSEQHPGGRQGTYLDWKTEFDAQNAQTVGQRQYQVTMAQRNAEADSAAQRSSMERAYDPRALSQRTADLNEINELVRVGDLTQEQATQRTAALPPLTMNMRPREDTIYDIAEKKLGVVPLKTSDGKVAGMAIVSTDRNGEPRYQGSMAEHAAAEPEQSQTDPNRYEYIDKSGNRKFHSKNINGQRVGIGDIFVHPTNGLEYVMDEKGMPELLDQGKGKDTRASRAVALAAKLLEPTDDPLQAAKIGKNAGAVVDAVDQSIAELDQQQVAQEQVKEAEKFYTRSSQTLGNMAQEWGPDPTQWTAAQIEQAAPAAAGLLRSLKAIEHTLDAQILQDIRFDIERAVVIEEANKRFGGPLGARP